MEKDNLIGKQFNQLTVVSSAGVKSNRTMWLCKCSCGKELTISQNNLTRAAKSCGCGRKKPKQNLQSHHLSGKPIYSVWVDMKRRCENPRLDAYKRYGAKGVSVCAEWHDVSKFYIWCLENGWRKGMCICRNGDKGNYSPDNCYIATKSQNSKDMYLFKRAA